MQLLINHLGYERIGVKHALIQTHTECTFDTAQLVCLTDGDAMTQLPIVHCGKVDQWHTGDLYQVDFSHIQTDGEYYLSVGDTRSAPFQIAEGLLMARTFSDVLHYFKSQRSSGQYDLADQTAPILNSDQTLDVRGGWYDASGDVSKYLSHLSYGNYLNPQQIPMVVWNMAHAYSQLEDEQDTADFTRTRLLEELVHGADFLLRMQSPQGYFYMTVFDKWSKSTRQRDICAYTSQNGDKTADYQAGFRQGGGVAIAALAATAHLSQQQSISRVSPDYAISSLDYLAAACKGYWHLKENNTQYLDDGKENIIDEYCALLACVELYKATEQAVFLDEARDWAARLSARQCSDNQQTHFWSATQDGSRPFYHAAEAGLPAIALMRYLSIESKTEHYQPVAATLQQALQFELTITHEVNNPFGYPRQYTKAVDGEKQSAFFIPHNNETGYWWQGENARIASLAAMAFMAQTYIEDPQLARQLKDYGHQALNWIVGLNPFDMSMLDGHGRNNPDYLPHLGFYNAKGGVCNGITSGFNNERDIAFNPDPQKDDMLQNWRWGEQWIPHGAWYLLAITLQYKERYHA
ncbi:chitobiase [Photobacterium swingsii]|uniref:Chitobiase n=1 Tax=Photobacterium swingsii TaxID=680026 RepID=A0A0J8V6P5_9GAMM|nr:glycoside hydrolase family 9 protein [Photobacterium swingsii]KMV29103.1 chitobiase [Photobacterium swingsii]PSW19443.1 chitobiase [Photobacterium swingsii]